MKHFIFNSIFLILVTACLMGCTTPSRVELPGSGQDYILGVGDRVSLNVYNQEKLSGEFTVNAAGDLALPLLENVHAAGMTAQQLEESIKTLLQPTYLNDPKVSIQVLNYRSVYVLGEVTTPGKYEYVPDMTMLQAIATAGGYTPRASEGSATVRRHEKNGINIFDIDDNTLIKPGDVVVVNRRWF